jgi:hypothetical protein
MSFTRLDPTDFVVSSDSVTAPAWTGNKPTLSSFTADPNYATATSYYLDVYNANPATSGSEVQFSIAIGDLAGTMGSTTPLNSLIPSVTPVRINYGQFRNLVYGDAERNFTFGATTSTQIVAITINRNRYKESLFPGTMILNINGTYLTDNSLSTSTINYLDCGRAFTLVATTGPSAPGSGSGNYGLFLPDIGTIILNNTGGTYGTTAAAVLANITSFTLNSQETISSNYVFVRVKNGEYNYTTNPSFITGSGALIYSNFINSPQTYPTTVGLYNDNNELLAVAKMSKPLTKDFTKEALVRVKLDW